MVLRHQLFGISWLFLHEPTSDSTKQICSDKIDDEPARWDFNF